MRCYCCDIVLTTEESCQRFRGSGDYTEMCNKCIRSTDLQDQVISREYSDEEEVFEDNELDLEYDFDGDEDE